MNPDVEDLTESLYDMLEDCSEREDLSVLELKNGMLILTVFKHHMLACTLSYDNGLLQKQFKTVKKASEWIRKQYEKEQKQC